MVMRSHYQTPMSNVGDRWYLDEEDFTVVSDDAAWLEILAQEAYSRGNIGEEDLDLLHAFIHSPVETSFIGEDAARLKWLLHHFGYIRLFSKS